MSESSHLRPRGFFEILDGSVRHYRARFGRFLKLFLPAAAINLVAGLLGTAFQVWAMRGGAAQDPVSSLAQAMGLLSLTFVLSLVTMAVMLLGFGSTIHLSAADLEGRTLLPSEAWRRTSSRFWALFGLWILVSWIVGLASLLLIVPGVLLAIRFGVSGNVLLLEDANVGDAMGRSGQLVSGSYGRGFGILCFLWILSAVFSVMPMALAMGSIFFLDDQGEVGNPLGYWITMGLGDTASALVGLLVWPLMALVATHFYWDLRVRREGLDLRTKLERIEPASP